jgi:hypothetical protein
MIFIKFYDFQDKNGFVDKNVFLPIQAFSFSKKRSKFEAQFLSFYKIAIT